MAAVGRFSDYRVLQWLNGFDEIWLGLAFDNPDTAGAYASEVFGNAYTRQKISMSLGSNRAIYNVSSVNFTGLPAVEITHLVGWDAQYNGNYEFMVPLQDPLRVGLGQSFPIAAQQVVLSFA